MAYGTNAPFGLQPRQYLTGATFNGQLSEYLINPAYATAIFSGDPVTFLNDGTIGRWAAGQACSGTFWGVKYIANVPNSQGNATFSPYWPGNQSIAPSTSVTALIADDPTILYDVQASSSSTGNASVAQLGVTAHNVNLNANLSLVRGPFADAIVPQNPGTGSTISGQSGFYLDTSTISASSNLLLKIIRLTPRPGNVFYTAGTGIGDGTQGAFNNVICALNNSTFKGGTGTAGGQVVVATGTLSAANMIAMNGGPETIVAAPGAGFAIVVNSFVLSMADVNDNTAYSGGGVIGLQYGATPALAGTRVTTTQPATILTTNSFGPFTFTGVSVTPADNTAVTISNAGVAFASGTPSYQYTITYTVVPFPY